MTQTIVGAPGIHTLPVVDEREGVINMVVAIVGEHAEAYLKQLLRETADGYRPESPTQTADRIYMRLRLGEMGDYAAVVHFFGFPLSSSDELVAFDGVAARAEACFVATSERDADAVHGRLHFSLAESALAESLFVLTGSEQARHLRGIFGHEPTSVHAFSDGVLAPVRELGRRANRRVEHEMHLWGAAPL